MKLDCARGGRALAAGAAADAAAGAVQVRAGHGAGARLRRRARRRAAHRPLPRAGRRVRLRAAGAGAASSSLLPPSLQSPVLASMVLSMLATPFIILYSNRIVMRLSASDWLMQSVRDDDDRASARSTPSAHVIICGYGRSGQNLARLLEAEKHPLHRARPRPRPRAPGRRRRPERRVRRRGAAAEPDGRRPGARQRRRRQLPRHAVGAEDPAPRAARTRRRCRSIVRTHRRQRPRAAAAPPARPRSCPRRSRAR